MATRDKQPNMKRSVLKKTGLIAVYALPLIGLAAFGGYYFKKYNELQSNPISAEQATQQEEERTLREVGKLYELPTDEKPTIATVKDKEALKKQYPDFFDKAENGDKLLVYQNAKLAILYRPSFKQLIKVGPLQVQENPVVKVVGTDAERAAIEKQLKDAKLTVQAGSAAKGQIIGVTVVDVSGKNTEFAAQVATAISGKVGSLPEGEDKPEGVDILVFVGPVAPAAE